MSSVFRFEPVRMSVSYNFYLSVKEQNKTLSITFNELTRLDIKESGPNFGFILNLS